MTHTTAYGNTYSDEDWKEIKAGYAEEAARDKLVTDVIGKMKNYLRRQLKEEGLNQDQVNQVVSLFANDRFVNSNIKFTSAKRQAKINDLWTRWNTAMNKLEVY